MIPYDIGAAESFTATHWREYAIALNKSFGWEVCVARVCPGGDIVFAYCVTPGRAAADPRGIQTVAQAREGVPSAVCWETFADAAVLLADASPAGRAAADRAMGDWGHFGASGPLAQEAIVVRRNGRLPRLQAIAPPTSLVAAKRQWAASWLDAQNQGDILTLAQCNSISAATEPRRENQGRISRHDQHRGITVSEWETVTDFGSPHCEVHLGFHKTKATAERQFGRIWEVYGRRPGSHVWLRKTP